jgi:hypothetical protein
MRATYHLMLVLIVLLTITMNCSAAPPANEGAVKTAVTAVSKSILLAAHPFAIYKSVRISDVDSADSEYVVKTEIAYRCRVSKSDFTLEVVTKFSKDLKFKSLEWGKDSGPVPPGLVAKTSIALIGANSDKSEKFEKERMRRIDESNDRNTMASHMKTFTQNVWAGSSIKMFTGPSGKQEKYFATFVLDIRSVDNLWLFTRQENTLDKTDNLNLAFDAKYDLLVSPDNEKFLFLRCFVKHSYMMDKDRKWEEVKGSSPFAVISTIVVEDGQIKRNPLNYCVSHCYLTTESGENLSESAESRERAAFIRMSAPSSIGWLKSQVPIEMNGYDEKMLDAKSANIHLLPNYRAKSI